MSDPIYEQLPAELDLAFIKGDEFGVLLTVDLDLSGYTYDSRIYALTTAAAGAGLAGGVATVAGGTVTAFTITPVSATAGIINVSLTEQQTDALSTTGTYRWWLKAVSPAMVTRTFVSGDVTVRLP
ncbi:hypothetical protein EB118_21475 [bacterium]|nr:hypothetical protein [bacterium]